MTPPIIVSGSGLIAWLCAKILLKTTPHQIILLSNNTKTPRMHVALTPDRLSWLETHIHCPHAQFGIFQSMHVFGPEYKLTVHANQRPLAYLVDLALLRKLLKEQIEKHPRLTVLNETIQEISQVAIQTTAHSHPYHSLIIAEGHHSPTRELAGWPTLPAEPSHIDFKACASLQHIRTDKMHQGRSYQYFHERGIYAYLPMAQADESIFITHHVAPSERENSPLPFGAHHALSPAHSFPLTAMHINPCHHGRIGLLGDSRHRIHPLTGLGLNTGLYCAQMMEKQLGLHCQLTPYWWQEHQAMTSHHINKAYYLSAFLGRCSQSGLGRAVIDSGLGLSELMQLQPWYREQTGAA